MRKATLPINLANTPLDSDLRRRAVRACVTLAIGLAACAAPGGASAQTIRTWNVTSGTWATTSNWGGTTPTLSLIHI